MFEDIKSIPLFQGLSESELDAIKRCLREKTFSKGEILFQEGKSCERVFIVRKGRVKLYRLASSGREQILETLEPGDTCACNPGSCDWVCTSSAEALGPTTAWFLSRNDYIQMVQSNSKLARTLNMLFAKRLQRFSFLIEEVSLKDVKKRLVKFLLDMQKCDGAGVPAGKVVQVPFTREEIAQRIGTARETVARYLYQLKRAKLIDIKPHQIVLLNRASLEKMLQ